jgi:hypothetical protein
MTDMPKEIFAWPARLAYEEVGQWATTRYPTEADKFIRADVVEARIAEAVAKEREECAQVAASLGVYPELNVNAGGPEWYRHGQRVAANIRSRA